MTLLATQLRDKYTGRVLHPAVARSVDVAALRLFFKSLLDHGRLTRDDLDRLKGPAHRGTMYEEFLALLPADAANVARQDDEAARERLLGAFIEWLLRRAGTWQRKLAGRNLELDDLVQEAVIAFWEAARRHRADGAGLAAFSEARIGGALARVTDRQRAAHVPAATTQSLREYRRERAVLTRQLERDPTAAELETVLGLPAWKLGLLAGLDRQDVRLHEQVEDEDGGIVFALELLPEGAHEGTRGTHNGRPLPVLTPQATTAEAAFERAGREAESDRRRAILLRALSARERETVTSVQTGRDLAAALGVTPQMVSKIRQRALGKLREEAESRGWMERLPPSTQDAERVMFRHLDRTRQFYADRRGDLDHEPGDRIEARYALTTRLPFTPAAMDTAYPREPWTPPYPQAERWLQPYASKDTRTHGWAQGKDGRAPKPKKTVGLQLGADAGRTRGGD